MVASWSQWTHQLGCPTSNPVSAGMGDSLWTGNPPRCLTINQVNSALQLHLSGIAKSSTSFGWGEGWNVTSAGWQVTRCYPIWHVRSRSGEAKLRLPLPDSGQWSRLSVFASAMRCYAVLAVTLCLSVTNLQVGLRSVMPLINEDWLIDWVESSVETAGLIEPVAIAFAVAFRVLI